MDIASEIQRRNDRASADAVEGAVRAALRDALHDLIEAHGVAYLEVFLARCLQIAESLRTWRPHEPEALLVARPRNADAIEAALREIIGSMSA